jgi:hypothetical protein
MPHIDSRIERMMEDIQHIVNDTAYISSLSAGELIATEELEDKISSDKYVAHQRIRAHMREHNTSVFDRHLVVAINAVKPNNSKRSIMYFRPEKLELNQHSPRARVRPAFPYMVNNVFELSNFLPSKHATREFARPRKGQSEERRVREQLCETLKQYWTRLDDTMSGLVIEAYPSMSKQRQTAYGNGMPDFQSVCDSYLTAIGVSYATYRGSKVAVYDSWRLRNEVTKRPAWATIKLDSKLS